MFSIRALVAIVLSVTATRGWSQNIVDSPDRYRKDVAGARAQPEFDPLGIPLAGMIVHPDVAIITGYNSNVFSRSQSIVSDGNVVVKPSLKADGDWQRYALGLQAEGTLTRFFTLREQDSDEYRVEGSGSIDLNERLSMRSSVEYARQVEARGTSGNRLLTGEPVYFDRFAASIAGKYKSGRFAIEAVLAYRQLRYPAVQIDAETEIDQRFRDSDGIGGRLTILYAVGPAMTVLGQVVADRTENPHQIYCCTREANGLAALGGFRFDSGGRMVGQVALGYRRREFGDPAQRPLNGLTYDVRVEWYPRPLFTFSVTADRKVQNSGLFRSNEALVDTQTLRVDYELLRNFLIAVSGSHETTTYRSVSTRTNLKTVSLRATYTPRRALQCALFATGRFNRSNRADVASGYDGYQLGFSAKVRL